MDTVEMRERERQAVISQAARVLERSSTADIERVTRLLTNNHNDPVPTSPFDKPPASESLNAARVMGSTGGLPRDPLRAGLTLDTVEDVFTYHAWDSFQRDAGEQVRDALVAAAKVILRIVPDGPDRSVALRKLRECRMDCNSAITHGGRF